MGHAFVATALGKSFYSPLPPPAGARNSGSKEEAHPCILTPLSLSATEDAWDGGHAWHRATGQPDPQRSVLRPGTW